MEVKEMVKREIEEEVVKAMYCDECKREIEFPGTCGYGPAYTLSDSNCTGCGGKTYHLCTLDCLKEFVKCVEDES